jgi:hypothetical protein
MASEIYSTIVTVGKLKFAQGNRVKFKASMNCSHSIPSILPISMVAMVLWSGCPRGQGDMGLAGAARAKSDNVLAPFYPLAPCQFQHLHLVKRRDHLELEAVQAFGDTIMSTIGGFRPPIRTYSRIGTTRDSRMLRTPATKLTRYLNEMAGFIVPDQTVSSVMST